ncbi:MAG TPA: protein phosphatase 2C domain-containing protein [Kofleriaceae bacterium]|nr:protein phosphatase 2C domain-containing protein [Kofleriaceae bacterium]
MTLEAWLVTDVGVVREHNEDSAYMEPANGFFIVADGMGGHAAGEVASAMAVDTVRKTLEGARREIDLFKRGPTDAGRRGIVQLLQSAVLSAHQAVFQRGQHEADKAGMGTTLDVVLVAGPEAFVAHVGDSRTYLVRDGRSSQITTDHTVAEVLVIEGKLTIEEAQVSPLRTILVNAIGVSADVGVEMAHVTLKRGDRLLLCSDGLHDYFPTEEEIAQKLSADAPGDALKDMVELAKTRGGHDNITGVAVQVTDVIEAVPAQLEGEHTQPVDAPSTNPFASDEPTETALIETPGSPGSPDSPGSSSASAAPALTPTPPRTPQELKETQPMRIVQEDAVGDTIPPIDEPARLDPPPEPGAGAETEAKGDATRGFTDKPDAKLEGTADAADARTDAKGGANADAKGDAKADAKATSKAVVKTDDPASATDPTVDDTIDVPDDAPDLAAGEPRANGDGKPSDAGDAKASDGDAAPGDLAVGDSGRVRARRDGKDA